MINKISLVRARNVQYEYYATLKDELLFGDRPRKRIYFAVQFLVHSHQAQRKQ